MNQFSLELHSQALSLNRSFLLFAFRLVFWEFSQQRHPQLLIGWCTLLRHIHNKVSVKCHKITIFYLSLQMAL